MSLPLISCLCPTTGRIPDYLHLLNEAVYSFLQQDYPNKELIICNDCLEQPIVFDHPQVSVYNLDRFPNICSKLNWMIEAADGTYLCRWDDDDISLPWRLSISFKRIHGDLEWRPNRRFTLTQDVWEIKENPENSHTMALWHRDVLDRIGGYPRDLYAGEDQKFNQLLVEHGVGKLEGSEVALEDMFYIYRWGVSDRHLSDSSFGCAKDRWREIGRRAAARPSPPMTLNPRWQKDWVRSAAEFVEQEKARQQARQRSP